MDESRRCTATARSGNRCKKAAIIGAKVCRAHGGAAPQVKAKAKKRVEKEIAQKAVVLYGLPREIEPHQALLEEVHRTAGHVAWLGQVVQEIKDQQKLTHGVTKTIQLPDGSRRVEASAAVNIWLQLYQEERDRLVRVARSAIEAGVAERQVRLAEQQAEQLAQVITAILSDLGHSMDEPQVQETVRLRLLQGGRQAA